MRNLIVTLILLNVFELPESQRKDLSPEPNNLLYHVVAIPDQMLGNINIDGNIDDWYWVMDNYKIYSSALPLTADKQIKENYFSGEIIIAWSEISQKLYFVIKTEDDIHWVEQKDDLPSMGWNDGFQFAIDAGLRREDFTASDTLNNTMVIGYFCAPMPDSREEFGLRTGAKWLIDRGEYANWAYQVYKVNRGNRVMMTYEVEIALWDYWNYRGLYYSVRHTLKPNQVLGMTIALNDVDGNPSLLSTPPRYQWLTMCPSYNTWWNNSFWYSKFILDAAPASEKSRWRQVLGLFVP
jgi:hypothetical protein